MYDGSHLLHCNCHILCGKCHILYGHSQYCTSTAVIAINHDGNHQSAFIAEPYVRLTDRWLIFAQVDYLNQEVIAKNKNYAHNHSALEMMELGGGINFIPSASVRWRLEVYWKDYLHYHARSYLTTQASPDYFNVLFSATVSF